MKSKTVSYKNYKPINDIYSSRCNLIGGIKAKDGVIFL
jgi:hypothetical protein